MVLCGASSTCASTYVQLYMARLGASRSSYEPRCGRECLLARYLKFGVVSTRDSYLCLGFWFNRKTHVHTSQPGIFQFTCKEISPWSYVCGLQRRIRRILHDFGRFLDGSLSRLFYLSNLSDTQILIQAQNSRPFESICVGISL